VVFAGNSTAVFVLKQATSNLPIVFLQVPDPIDAGFVASLGQPGGTAATAIRGRCA
jgi:ABC-type uncharacterized transport system substrate-binding protein